MAALDIVQTKSRFDYGSSPSVTLDTAPTTGNLILVSFAGKFTDYTAGPSGYTLLQSKGSTTPAGRLYARVATAGQSATITATLATADDFSIIAIEIEGPFTDLTGITSGAADASASTTHTILDSSTAFSSDIRSLAGLIYFDSATPSSWSNSFSQTAVQAGTGVNQVVGSRLYTGSGSAQTVLTLASSSYGWEWLANVASPVAPSNAIPAFGRYGVRGPIR
jgi:hypothetical protein